MTNTTSFLALAAVGFIASAPAQAANGPEDPQAQSSRADLDRVDGNSDIVITGQAYEQELESPKRTRPVRDTPQTITVLTNEVIEQQNLLTLRDVLSTVPGITFGAGEGGGGYGDSITFRGYSANNDITVDGVRDSAQYTRTDPFNLEQVEITNGANSVISGAGSVGGNINIVTKRPQETTRRVVTGGVGTANYGRATVDLNQRVSDMIAVRLNAMAHTNDVPGRDFERFRRWGVAPALTIGIGGPTRLIVQYVHQEDDNIPQYGVPYYQNANNDGPLPGVDRSSYFGFRNVDRQQTNVDQGTVTFEHEFSDDLSFRNLARFQDVRQDALVNPPQGNYCLATGGGTGVLPTGASCAYPGYYLPSGPRGNTRITRNQLMFDQADLRAVLNTGPIEHTVTIGGAYTWERGDLSSGNSLRNANGTAAFATFPLINIDNPNDVVAGPTLAGFTYGSNVYTGALNYIPSQLFFGEQDNYAVYAFDAMKLGKFEINGGARLERNQIRFRADTVSIAAATLGQVTTGTEYRQSDDLFSYRIGLVYKPVQAVTLYAAFGNSETPSRNSVNAGNLGSVNSTCNTTPLLCINADPEQAKNYEVGAKAEVFNGGLLVALAAFRNERDKYLVPSVDPTVPDQQADGRSRVDGISASAIGKITRDWQITANYTYLDSELRQSVSDFCLANPGTTGCGNTTAVPNPGAGAQLQNTPKHSGSLFTTYRLPFGLTIGYGLTYQGSFAFAVPGTTAATIFRADDYIVHQGFLAYDVIENFSLQLNVKNIGDKEYYTRIRNNGWATPGEARAAILTATARF